MFSGDLEMKKLNIFCICTVMLVATSVFAGCLEVPEGNGNGNGNGNGDGNGEPEYWTWNLAGGEWTEITFTSVMIICVGSDTPEELFDSIIELSGELWVFQEYPPGDWNSWNPEREPYNSLEHIQPNTPFKIHVENTCILTIEKCI